MRAELLTENLFSMKDFIEQINKDDKYEYLTAPSYAIKGTIKDLHKLNYKRLVNISDLSAFQLIKSDATHVEFQNRDFPFCIENNKYGIRCEIENGEISIVDNFDDEDEDHINHDVVIDIFNNDPIIYNNIFITSGDICEDDNFINLEFIMETSAGVEDQYFINSQIEFPFDFDGFSLHTYPPYTALSKTLSLDIDNTSEYDKYDFEFIIVITGRSDITPILYGFVTRQFAGEEEKYIRVMDYLTLK